MTYSGHRPDSETEKLFLHDFDTNTNQRLSALKISPTCVCNGFCLGLVCEGWEGSLTGEFLEDSPILDPGREPPPRPPRRPPPPPGESSSAPSVVKCNCQACHLDIFRKNSSGSRDLLTIVIVVLARFSGSQTDRARGLTFHLYVGLRK